MASKHWSGRGVAAIGLAVGAVVTAWPGLLEGRTPVPGLLIILLATILFVALTWIELGFGVMGEGNLIIGNSVHDLSGMTGDSGDMNSSGGAEAYMVMGSNNEIAYNSAEPSLWAALRATFAHGDLLHLEPVAVPALVERIEVSLFVVPEKMVEAHHDGMGH